MALDTTREQDFLDQLLAATPTEAEHLLPVLQQVQAAMGFISQDSIRRIAGAFNLSRAEVYGVVTFYTDLREKPVGKHVVQLCMAEACQSLGCRELAAHAERSLGTVMGESTADGKIHFEAAYCFGNCALGPSMRIGERIFGRVTTESFDQAMAELRQDSPRADGAMS